MPPFDERLIHAALALALAVFAVSLLLIGAAIGRRIKRERNFKIVDSFRQQSRTRLASLAAGETGYAELLDYFQTMVSPPYVRDVERILLELLSEPRYAPAIQQLAEDLGMVALWQHGVQGTASLPARDKSLKVPPQRPRSHIRAWNAQNLGRLAHRPSWELLLSALNDPHRDVREAALRSLGAIEEPKSFPFLVEHLRQCAASAVPSLPERAFMSALACFPPQLANHFYPLLEDADVRVRLAAARALREMLARASGRAQAETSQLSPKLCRLVLTRLANEPNPDLRAAAADLLASVGSEAVAVLARMTEDNEWFVRLHAVRALGRCHEEAAVPALSARLTDAQWRVREAAARALASLGPKGAELLEQNFLSVRDEYAREQIIEALETSGWLDEMAARCAAVNGNATSAVLCAMVKMGKTDYLELWLHREGITKAGALLSALAASADPEVQRWARRMAV